MILRQFLFTPKSLNERAPGLHSSKAYISLILQSSDNKLINLQIKEVYGGSLVHLLGTSVFFYDIVSIFYIDKD